MATGQTLLDTMELLDQEAQLQAGESDVVFGLIALNRAQDYFESLAAQHPGIVNTNASTGTVTTTLNTETTAYPSGLLRIDRLQYLDPTSSLPAWDLEYFEPTGSHRRGTAYWNLVTSSTGTGKPRAYWANGAYIYWNPLPDATHTVRWYGLKQATDITASGTFLYPDICILPFATFAVALMSMGVGDELGDPHGLAQATFGSVIKTLADQNRDFAAPLQYSRQHDT